MTHSWFLVSFSERFRSTAARFRKQGAKNFWKIDCQKLLIFVLNVIIYVSTKSRTFLLRHFSRKVPRITYSHDKFQVYFYYISDFIAQNVSKTGISFTKHQNCRKTVPVPLCQLNLSSYNMIFNFFRCFSVG